MSYQVLARKWRPRTFQDMVGQEYILRMLTNALEQKRIHHAYLLTGTRGVGKTSSARILAKSLNCETGITATPCGICATCKAIDAGQFLDLFEIDAASRTKVEDTRELLDNVLYPPTQGRYKVYLIDEVHMLSNHSFNALLKTLEEPPAHVVFILATTDPKRLPVTILSRCLQFHLKRITPEQIAQHLQFVCQQENISYEDAALTRLAKSADGSMRDALSLLDQAIAYGNGSVNTQDVTTMLGSLSHEDLLPLLQGLAAQDGQACFSALTQLAEHAPDFEQVLEELISTFHQIAFTQIMPNALAVEDNIIALAKQFTAEDVQLYYQIALLGRRDLALSPIPQQGFEMTILRMLAFKLDNKEKLTITKPSAPTTVKTTPVAASNVKTATTVVTATVTPTPAATTASTTSAVSNIEWRELLPKLGLSGMAHALASNCSLEKITGTHVYLNVAVSHEPMLNAKLKERIAEALSRELNKKITLEIATSTNELVTPVKELQQEQAQQLASAKASALEDPRIKKLVEMYDATVEVSLV